MRVDEGIQQKAFCRYSTEDDCWRSERRCVIACLVDMRRHVAAWALFLFEPVAWLASSHRGPPARLISGCWDSIVRFTSTTEENF